MRAPHRHLLLPLLLATAAAVPALAQTGSSPLTNYPACTTTPSKQDSDQAHDAFKLGKRFFDEADYGSAIHNFADAYKLDCTKTELLTIIARAFELNGNRGEAVHALETYLERAQGVSLDDKAQIQKRIDNLKAQMPTQQPSATGTATTAPTVTATAPATAVPTHTAPTASGTASAPPPQQARGHTALPWIVAGVGAAAAVAGGIVYLVEKSAANTDLTKALADCVPGTGQSNCVPLPGKPAKADGDAYNSANNLVTVGTVLFWSGLGVAAGGVIWHFLEPTGSKTETKAQLAPAVAPGYAGVSLGAKF
jgi:hypothetical protein